MNLFVYILLCLFNRFLIIKLLIKRLIVTNAGIAPSGTTGLRKPPESLLPTCLCLCLHQCGLLKRDLLQENAISQIRLSLQPLNEKRIFQEYNYFGLLLKKQNHPHASVGRCQLHSAFVRARCYYEATSEQWTQKHFQTWEKGGLTRIGKQNHPTYSLRNRGSRGQSIEGAHPRDNCMRKYLETVTCSVLNHFQGIEKLLLDFMMLTGVSWLTHVNRHLHRSRGRREGLASALSSGSPPLTHHL